MEKKTLKAGIVGSGFAAAFHYEALLRVFGTKVEITGAYSATREKLVRFTKARNIRAFRNLEELVKTADVIHVCTPPVTHEPIVVAALKQNKHVIVEKPFTGYFGDGSENFNGESFSKVKGLEFAMQSIRNMMDAEKAGSGRILYAENWIYAPAIQKEKELLQKTGAQILWMHGEEAHSGSHSLTYGIWKFSGGGSMIGKGCHPLLAALYLKQVEGLARNGKPIRPKTISARTHAITRMPAFQNDGFLKTTYQDTGCCPDNPISQNNRNPLYNRLIRGRCFRNSDEPKLTVNPLCRIVQKRQLFRFTKKSCSSPVCIRLNNSPGKHSSGKYFRRL